MLVAIVPLMVLGGTGSWRNAWTALREYVQIVGGLALFVTILAALMVGWQFIG